MKSRDFKIGCSGYYYLAWKNAFYPENISPSNWLAYYSTVFNTVELNGTFYRVPKLNDLKKYARQTPPEFVFTVKMNKYITHILRLNNTKQKIYDFCDLVMEGLDEKLATILYQLPPSFIYSEANLETVCNNVPNVKGSVVEFRNKTWWNENALKRLKTCGISFCNTDYPGLAHEHILTTTLYYARMHGVPELFKSTYPITELTHFARHIPVAITNAYIYFNNTYYDGAYKNAFELMKIVGLIENNKKREF